MTEAAQVFNQTVGERSKQKNSAFHKKNGSAVAKLGNKRMSWQEIQSKHGECLEFDLGNFMDYDTFKKMAPDTEAEYVNKLCARYGVRMEHVSVYLFHAGEKDLLSRLKIVGVDKKIKQKKTTEVSDENVQQFKDDITLWEEREATAKIIDLSEATRKKQIIENVEFINYDEFSNFALDEKVAYLNSLVSKYDVSVETIERELFKVGRTTLREKLNKQGVLGQIKRGAYGRAATKPNKAFHDAVIAWRGEPVVEEVPVEVKAEPVEEEITDNVLVPSILSNAFGDSATEQKESVEEVADIHDAEEAINQRIEEINEKLMPKPLSLEDVKEIAGVPKTEVEHVEIASKGFPEIDFEFKPLTVEEKPAVQPQEMSFTTNYISDNGLDEKQLFTLMNLFAGKNIKVSISIQSV